MILSLWLWRLGRRSYGLLWVVVIRAIFAPETKIHVRLASLPPGCGSEIINQRAPVAAEGADKPTAIHDYLSDITRSYVFGEPTSRQKKFWNIEKSAQLAAFHAAKIGVPCEAVDDAARDYLASQDLGPEYQTPGCPHRTGHGIGLDIHEWPYLVGGNKTPLAAGMCFSNEPMLVVPDEFGIRLEDHFYMTDSGPRWFTEPSNNIDNPFGLDK